jgi:hypothetical protein
MVNPKSPDWLTTMISRGYCPDCNHRGFVIGPQAGLNINIECGKTACRSRFNASFWGGDVVFCERIEKFGEGGSIWPSEPRP